jgi:hypothetical protein
VVEHSAARTAVSTRRALTPVPSAEQRPQRVGVTSEVSSGSARTPRRREVRYALSTEAITAAMSWMVQVAPAGTSVWRRCSGTFVVAERRPKRDAYAAVGDPRLRTEDRATFVMPGGTSSITRWVTPRAGVAR